MNPKRKVSRQNVYKSSGKRRGFRRRKGVQTHKRVTLKLAENRNLSSEPDSKETNETLRNYLLNRTGQLLEIRSQNVESRQTKYDDYLDTKYSHLGQRQGIYTEFLDDFQKKYSLRQKNKEQAKWDFYDDVMSVFYVVLLVLVLLITLLILSGANSSSMGQYVPTIIAGLISVITSLIVVPKVLANYLFDPKEDSDVIQLVLGMQTQDAKSDYMDKSLQGEEQRGSNESTE